MEKLIKKIKERIRSYSLKQTEFTPYCKEKMRDRNIGENLVTTTLFSNNLYYAKKQIRLFKEMPETRHMLVFKISSRYSLIIIVLFEQKILKVLNVIKTSKEVEKWRKKMLR